ncbi:MAG: nucleotidyltransferase domain-containing protein [Gammaproteobacteria bacterium]|nr:nucleotidyltransferase domain-containing protein [Gammaproteobacteria bacterium]
MSTMQVARETGLSRQAVRLVLDSLLAQGAVRALGTPRSRLFAAVDTAPLVPALKPLFAAERAHWEGLNASLRDALAASPDVRSAWLYGSVVRREDTPASDLDLAVVLSNRRSETSLRDELEAVGTRFDVHVSLVALTTEDIRSRPVRDPWWAGLERDAQVLKGSSPAQERARARERG